MNETQNVLETREKYRNWMNSALGAGIGLGILGLLVGVFLERDLFVVLGVGVYWLGVMGYVTVKWRAPVTVRDEREARINREAAELTLDVLAALLIVAAPGLTVLSVTSVYDVPEFYWGMVTMLAVVAMIVGVATWSTERKRS